MQHNVSSSPGGRKGPVCLPHKAREGFPDRSSQPGTGGRFRAEQEGGRRGQVLCAWPATLLGPCIRVLSTSSSSSLWDESQARRSILTPAREKRDSRRRCLIPSAEPGSSARRGKRRGGGGPGPREQGKTARGLTSRPPSGRKERGRVLFVLLRCENTVFSLSCAPETHPLAAGCAGFPLTEEPGRGRAGGLEGPQPPQPTGLAPAPLHAGFTQGFAQLPRTPTAAFQAERRKEQSTGSRLQ